MHSGELKIEKRASFLLACAGSGKRMSLKEPKQFLEYQGKPLFLKALSCAEQSNYIGEIIIVTQEEYISYVQKICQKEGLQKVKAVVAGGKERQDSVFAALGAISGKFPYVVVQDAARPFCKEQYFKDCWAALAEGYEGAVVGVPVKDTIKQVVGDCIVASPKRSELFAAHTPQVFLREILEEAYKTALEEKFLGTDDASLVERLGYRVKAICGDYDNIKITVKEDLKFLND